MEWLFGLTSFKGMIAMYTVHSQRLFVLMQLGFSTMVLGSILGGKGMAGDQIAYAHFNPADPRPDFFDKPHYNAWVPYRKVYNRPTYVGGHVAAIIEPTSQEAMAWKIAKAKGDYKCHRPGYIPTYYYPKPWEALSVEARPGEGQPMANRARTSQMSNGQRKVSMEAVTHEPLGQGAESADFGSTNKEEQSLALDQGVASGLTVDIN